MTEKKILASGCSFTYGDELEDRSMAWPSLVSATLCANLHNIALPGESSDYVLRSVIDRLSKDRNVNLVLIGYPMPGRLEFADNQGIYSSWPGNQDHSMYKFFPFRKQLQSYLDDHHNEKYLLSKWYINLISIQSFLKSINKPAVFVLVWKENFYYNKYKDDIDIIQLHKLVDWSLFTDNGAKSMAEYTTGCKLGPRKHFLEDGHKIVAKKIISYMEEKKIEI